MISIKYLNPNLTKNRQEVGDYESIHSVNPLYFIIDKVDGYIKEKNENKYLMY